MVTCVYVNPERDPFWLIDYRIYDPEGDGKSKLDHVQEMPTNGVYQKQLPVQAVAFGHRVCRPRPDASLPGNDLTNEAQPRHGAPTGVGWSAQLGRGT